MQRLYSNDYLMKEGRREKKSTATERKQRVKVPVREREQAKRRWAGNIARGKVVADSSTSSAKSLMLSSLAKYPLRLALSGRYCLSSE
jgi:hypothetical protein